MVYGLEFIKRRNKFYSYNMYAALIFYQSMGVLGSKNQFMHEFSSCTDSVYSLIFYGERLKVL